MTGQPRPTGAILGLFCTALISSPAWAGDDASAAETAAARSLAVDGLKLAQANNCAEAVPKLERAEKLYHSTFVAIRLGECYVSVGKLVEGTELLRRSIREPQSTEPTPALAKALERAQKIVDSTKPRIAGLTVKVATVQDMVVKIDGAVVPSALVDTEVPTDPGEHNVEVTAPGFLRSATRLSIGEGEKKNVSLTLTRDPNAAAASTTPVAAAAKEPTASAPAPVASPQAVTTPPSVERSPNRTGAYVAWGVGAAALAAGGVLGVMTMQKHSDLEGDCTDGACPPERQSDLDSAKRLGNFSTIAFGVGAAGAVLGTVLFFTAGPSREERAAGAKERRFVGLSRPRVAIGPTQLQLGADF
ncbi:MAG: hypothetical protein EOO73_17390 [Myxococcales bacterium]|nr:MAG: hypothetical protein EOO73_17390 [Myxococcales bacterium]